MPCCAAGPNSAHQAWLEVGEGVLLVLAYISVFVVALRGLHEVVGEGSPRLEVGSDVGALFLWETHALGHVVVGDWGLRPGFRVHMGTYFQTFPVLPNTYSFGFRLHLGI